LFFFFFDVKVEKKKGYYFFFLREIKKEVTHIQKKNFAKSEG